MECKLYVVESLEPDAYDNNFIINNKTKKILRRQPIVSLCRDGGDGVRETKAETCLSTKLLRKQPLPNDIAF